MHDLELCGAYLDHAYAQNLAKPPFIRICCEFENCRDLRALSGKFLRQKSCYPESFRLLRLCTFVVVVVTKLRIKILIPKHTSYSRQVGARLEDNSVGIV